MYIGKVVSGNFYRHVCQNNEAVNHICKGISKGQSDVKRWNMSCGGKTSHSLCSRE